MKVEGQDPGSAKVLAHYFSECDTISPRPQPFEFAGCGLGIATKPTFGLKCGLKLRQSGFDCLLDRLIKAGKDLRSIHVEDRLVSECREKGWNDQGALMADDRSVIFVA